MISTLRSGCVVAAVLALAQAHPAKACDRLPLVGLNFRVFPTDGARAVDPESMVLVPRALVDGAPRLLRGPDFEEVDVVVDELSVRGEFGGVESIFRLRPTAPLSADTLYRVAGDVVADGVADDSVRLGEFVVAGDDDVVVNAADLDAPELSAVTETQAIRDDSGFSCAFDGTAAATVAAVPDGALVIAANADDPDEIVGLGFKDVVIFGDDAFVVDVAIIDGQGRRSPATSLRLNLTAAPGPNCAQSSHAPWWGVAFVLAFASRFFRRRRRRFHAAAAPSCVAGAWVAVVVAGPPASACDDQPYVATTTFFLALPADGERDVSPEARILVAESALDGEPRLFGGPELAPVEVTTTLLSVGINERFSNTVFVLEPNESLAPETVYRLVDPRGARVSEFRTSALDVDTLDASVAEAPVVRSIDPHPVSEGTYPECLDEASADLSVGTLEHTLTIATRRDDQAILSLGVGKLRIQGSGITEVDVAHLDALGRRSEATPVTVDLVPYSSCA